MGTREERIQEGLTAWLRHFSGCHFAQTLAQGQDRVRMLILEPWDRVEELLEDLTTNLVQFGIEEHAVLIAFPDLQREQDVLRLLRRMADACDRWRLEVRAGDPASISVYWRTEEGAESDTMGLAPFLAMPPTRRTPYVCLALWPGVRSKSPPSGPVSFMDMPSRLPEDQHAKLISQTKSQVADILGPNRPAPGDYFTFRLPGRVLE